MTQLSSLPKNPVIGDPRLASDLLANDEALRTLGNNITSDQIVDGTLLDGDLASPNNGAYKRLTHSAGLVLTGSAAAHWMTVAGNNAASGSATGSAPQGIFTLLAARYAVAGKTTKLYVEITLGANGTAPASTFTAGLYPVTAGGAASNFVPSLGVVVTGSTAAVATPSASAFTTANSGDFTLPADGTYILGFAMPGSLAANTALSITISLSIRNV